jgi:hypothetical protein
MTAATIDLRPNTLDLELYAGDGAGIRLSVTDNDQAPLEVTGVVEGQIRVKRLDSAPVAEFTADLSEAAEGVVTVSLTGEQTAALITNKPIFSGVWDVQWTKPGAQPITIAQGKVRVHADVTR